MDQESIQCDGCECWMHQQCVNMTMLQYVTFSQPHLQFFCRHCAYSTDGYNCVAALSRIAECSPDIQSMRSRAESERNLLQFYAVSLPPVQSVCSDNLTVHGVSVELLRDYSPWLLDNYRPVDVAGDGNCLFRAVSVALYGHERSHSHIRLLAAIEVLLYPGMYDKASPEYYQPYKVDEELVLLDYTAFACDVVRNFRYSDMHTVLAISSVIQKPVQTRWPIRPKDRWEVPLTKLVYGRDVQTTNAINILWTTGAARYEGKNPPPTLNHFVPLLNVSPSVSAQEKTDHDDNAGSDQLSDGDVDADNDADEPATMQDARRLGGRFLSLADCISILNDDDNRGLERCPNGVKENVCFKVSNH